MEKIITKIIENAKLPDIINMLNTGNLTDTETNDIAIDTIIISNGDILIKPVLNPIESTILYCLKFGIESKILDEEPDEFETECLQFIVFKYDKNEKTFLTYDLWEFLTLHNFINENFNFVVDLELEPQNALNEKNLALINNWSVYCWV